MERHTAADVTARILAADTSARHDMWYFLSIPLLYMVFLAAGSAGPPGSWR
jgi:hypothetical protein